MLEKFDINMNTVLSGHWRRCRHLGAISVNVMPYLNGSWIGKLSLFVPWTSNAERFQYFIKTVDLKKKRKTKLNIDVSIAESIVQYIIVLN